jgi:hypothetical protein
MASEHEVVAGATKAISRMAGRLPNSQPRGAAIRPAQREKDPAPPPPERTGSQVLTRPPASNQLPELVLMELLIGLMSGIVWIPELVAS